LCSYYDLWEDFSTCKFFGNLRRAELAFCPTCCRLAAAVHLARRRNRALDHNKLYMEYKRAAIATSEKELKDHYEAAQHAVVPHVCEDNIGASLSAFAQRVQNTRVLAEDSIWVERTEEEEATCLELVRARVNNRSGVFLSEKVLYRMQAENKDNPKEMLTRILKSICLRTRRQSAVSGSQRMDPGWAPVVFNKWNEVQPGSLLVYRRRSPHAAVADLEPNTSWGLFWVSWVRRVRATYHGHCPVEMFGHELVSRPHRRLRMKGTLHTERRNAEQQEWLDAQRKRAQRKGYKYQRPSTINSEAALTRKTWIDLQQTKLFFFPIVLDGAAKHYFMQPGDGIVHLPRQHRRQTGSALFSSRVRAFDGAQSSKRQRMALRLTLTAEFLLHQVPRTALPQMDKTACAVHVREFFGCV